MDELKILQIIIDQQKEVEISSHDTPLIAREQSFDLKEIIQKPAVKTIIGVRRAGKSTLLLQALADKSFLYFNFDDEILSQILATDLTKLLELGYRCNSNPKYIVFDEIQNVAGWELFINKLHRQKKNILLTGSNSRLLSSELATHLTGRQISIELFPFSYAEYLTSQKLDVQNPVITTSKQRLEFENQFMNYLNRGGFPEIINEEIGSRYSQLYLKELYDKIINRDLVQRRKIKNIKALKEIAVHMMSLYSSQFTYQSVKKNSTYLSINTVKNYIDYLQEAYMGFVLDPYSFKIKERISLPKKYYVIDTALVESVVGRTTIDLGKKLENIIFIELKRRGHEIYYLNEPSYEVDFIIREGKEIIELIQVCWSTRDFKTKNREIAAFVKAAKKLNCQKCTLITFNEEANVSADGLNIHIIPAWQWLLTKSHPS